MLANSTKVRVSCTNVTGIICGVAGYDDGDRTELFYLVKLDVGFVTPGNELFISVIVAHFDMVIVL